MNKPYDDSNWREEYKQYTSNKRHLELLENGPKQLSQAWVLQALYNAVSYTHLRAHET